MSLELSFRAYREAAEGNIARLERENRLWKLGAITGGVLSAVFGALLLLGR